MNSKGSNYIQKTNDFVYVPPQSFQNDLNKNEPKSYNIYVNKFKTAIYCFVLFILLSSQSAYKIMDIVIKIFSKNVEILDDDCAEPAILGRVIMGVFMSIIIFIL